MANPRATVQTSARVPQEGLAPAVERLLATLDSQRAQYARLLAGIRARREAIRTADFARFRDLGESETRIVVEISNLDRARLDSARGVATALGIAPDSTLAAIAERLPETPRARLDLARAELRTLIEDTRRESGVVRQAAERLSAHMAGILQTVHSALSHAGVYSRGGRIAVGANVVSTVDIRS
jgi:hypothetical protein